MPRCFREPACNRKLQAAFHLQPPPPAAEFVNRLSVGGGGGASCGAGCVQKNICYLSEHQPWAVSRATHCKLQHTTWMQYTAAYEATASACPLLWR